MKKLMVFLCAMFLVFALSGTAGAISWVNGADLSTWNDVNKSGTDDGLLCWAAAAANALAWNDWDGLESDGTTLISTPGGIFDYFKAGWPDSTSNVMYGYDWWFDNVDSDINDDPTTDAGFYADHNLIPGIYGGYWGTNPPDETAFLSYMDTDRALEIQIDTGSYLHSLTVWGIDAVNDRLYFTDSDDAATQLVDLSYSVSGANLVLAGYTNAYTAPTDATIIQLVRLDKNSSGFAPKLFDEGEIPPVPEPATMFLLGTSLLGLAYFSKKRKRS